MNGLAELDAGLFQEPTVGRIPSGRSQSCFLATGQEEDMFRKFSNLAAEAMGSPWAFVGAILAVLLWAVTGPLFNFSDTWQLIINTGTTVLTFLMVFLVQNTQNRDARATQLKLDELIRALEGARTGLVNLEELPDDQLLRLQEQFERLRQAGNKARFEKAADEIAETIAQVEEDERPEARRQ